MTIIQQKQLGKQCLLVMPQWQTAVNADWFNPAYWQQRGQLSGSAPGRGTTHFIAHDQGQWVLRHYRRGGLVGKLIADAFVYLGLFRTRAHQELSLLAYMRTRNLPCPAPVAGRITRSGLIYRADIISERIPGAVDVHHILCEQALSTELWRAIGMTIRRFHNEQIYHHDLNIHNIMLDEDGGVWLIDFDKCARRNTARWKGANLQRLRRSLDKEQARQARYHFHKSNWQALLQGYEQGPV